MKIIKRDKEKGFSLFLTILLISIVLSIVIGLSNVIINQYRAMRTIENSVNIFYGSETGAERALFGLFKGGVNINHTYEGELDNGVSYVANIYCCNPNYFDCQWQSDNCPIIENEEKKYHENCYAKAFCIYSTGILGRARKTLEIKVDQYGVSSGGETGSTCESFNLLSIEEYCINNQGVSYVDGDKVYCDENYRMWTTTLLDEDNYPSYFKWKNENTLLPEYANNDCNNLTDQDIENYPACNACRDLVYACSSNWRLPTQEGYDGTFCAPGRELWDFGAENCGWSSSSCLYSQKSCEIGDPQIDWDEAWGGYWSSTESHASGAYYVAFNDGAIFPLGKIHVNSVRCVIE